MCAGKFLEHCHCQALFRATPNLNWVSVSVSGLNSRKFDLTTCAEHGTMPQHLSRLLCAKNLNRSKIAHKASSIMVDNKVIGWGRALTCERVVVKEFVPPSKVCFPLVS